MPNCSKSRDSSRLWSVIIRSMWASDERLRLLMATLSLSRSPLALSFDDVKHLNWNMSEQEIRESQSIANPRRERP